MMQQTVKRDGPYPLEPAASSGPWWQRRACSEATAELFFTPPQGERSPERRARIRAAKAICAQCPVGEQCEDEGRQLRDDHSIRNGKTPEQRQAERNRPRVV